MKRPGPASNRSVLFAVPCAALALLAAVFWIYGRFVPNAAASKPCTAPAEGYRCRVIDGFALSVFGGSEAARGVPILLLHGGPGFSSVGLQRALSPLAEHHPLYTYDQRGSGYSEIKPDLDHYTFEKLIDEVEAVRRAVIEGDRVILIGHSFGARLALGYALRYPERVAKMVLLSAPAPRVDASRVRDLLSLGIPPADPERANDWLRAGFHGLFATSEAEPGAFARFDPGYTSYAVMMKATQSMLDDPRAHAELDRLDVPTLILFGDRELSNTGRADQERLHAALTRSELVEVEHAGHWSFVERPAEVVGQISDFIDRPAPPRGP